KARELVGQTPTTSYGGGLQPTDSRIAAPHRRLDRLQAEPVRDRPRERDGARGNESPEKAAGGVDDKARQRGRHDAGEVAAKILDARPATDRERAGDRLRDRPVTGG